MSNRKSKIKRAALTATTTVGGTTTITTKETIDDCWRCCIAYLLKLEASAVPHFVRKYKYWEKATRKWLEKRGYTIDRINAIHHAPPRGKHIKVGLSWVDDDGTVIEHAVIGKGWLYEHDPNPSQRGLMEVGKYYTIRKNK
jgi:hypothetical protein